MEYLNGTVSIDPEVVHGQSVFPGTRVPVVSLLQHLELGISLEDWLEDFPTVKRDAAVAFLNQLKRVVTPEFLKQQSEIFA